MRVVLVVLCVGLAMGDEPPKADGPGDSEPSASEGSQWAPFFSEASRASEGLPWGSVAPELASDLQSAQSGHRESHPNPQSNSSGQPDPINAESFDRGDAVHTSGDRKDVHKVTITKKVRVPYTVHVEKHIPKIIEVPVDKPFNVYVPKPYPVIVEKKVPYEIKVHQPQPYTVEKRVPYPVKVLVDKPYTLHVPKPYPVDVEKKYEFTVEKKIPYEVKVPVERPYPVHVILEKEVKFPVETKVPVPVKVPYEKPIPIHVTKHVPVNVDKPVPYTVEKVATYPVKVPFRIPIKVHYPEGGSAEDIQGSVQNFEWAEAMNKATRQAKLESRPSQWHGSSQGQFQWQGVSQVPSEWQVESQNSSQGPSDYQIPPQWHIGSHSPAKNHVHSPRPSHWQELSPRPSPIRQGFSAGRGPPTRNSYLLSKYAIKRPTTKLQPVGHHYEVKEPQFEQVLTAPFLNTPGSEVIVPQMVLADSPPNTAGELSNTPSRGLQQSNSLGSGLQQSNSQQSGLHHSNFPIRGLPQPNYVSGFQANPPSNPNSGTQQGSVPLVFTSSVETGGFSSLMLNNQHSSFVDHQGNKSGNPSFSITNVIHHTGPSQQTALHQRSPSALSGKPHRLQAARVQYVTSNSLGSESAQPPSAFFKPARNTSTPTHRSKTPLSSPPSQRSNSVHPFGSSEFTISFHSPPSALQQPQKPSLQQPQTLPQHSLTSPQQSLKSPQQSLTSPQESPILPQLFKPTGGPAQNNDHVSTSFTGTKTVRDGQELNFSTAIQHSQNSPNRPEKN